MSLTEVCRKTPFSLNHSILITKHHQSNREHVYEFPVSKLSLSAGESFVLQEVSIAGLIVLELSLQTHRDASNVQNSQILPFEL